MQKVKKAARNTIAKDRANKRTLFPLVALGGSLVAAPAAALELGEVSVQSSLGQPLRASIAYALAPSEMLSNTCVSVSSGQSTGGLPGIGKSRVRITESAILIAGETVVREPMLGARVTINCPYTPNLSREYMLFVDPATLADTRSVVAAPVARPEAEPRVQTSAATATARVAPINNTPIGQSARYQVQSGDTLGDIVRRIENRSMTLWPAVNLIFAANPDAFIDNDPNRLKAGSWLNIPSLDGTAPVVSTATPEPVATPVAASTAVADTAESTYEPAATVTVAEPVSEQPIENAAMDSTADLKPGDVVMDNTRVEATETTVIPDTQLEGPQTSSSSPNVATAIVSTGSRTESTSMLMWLVGGGLAIIAGLILFGRRIRSRFGTTPPSPFVERRQAQVAQDTDTVEAFANYDLEDDSPTEENLALDADLVIGTGLEQGVEMEVAQDFGFAATTDLDIELPFEPQAEDSTGETDIIPPMTDSVESILESEVLPEDDDYDMSVIMDATKMPQPEEVTEHDLKAVAVGADDEALIAENYTISTEVDYEILEQDYEEELTATQALNLEIERAASELASDLNETTDDEITAAMPLATVTEIDVTAELPAREDEQTAEFEASYDPNDTNAITVNISDEEKTAEMPVANDDETAEMEISGGTVDTRSG